jgi:ethanolamine utilization protein EutN
MLLARVKKRVISDHRHEAYAGRHVFVVRQVDPDGAETGDEFVAVDTVGAGPGDTVVCGGAPGVAREVFGLERAPIRTLIVGIVAAVRTGGTP